VEKRGVAVVVTPSCSELAKDRLLFTEVTLTSSTRVVSKEGQVK
jgi:hypothetical protein